MKIFSFIFSCKANLWEKKLIKKYFQIISYCVVFSESDERIFNMEEIFERDSFMEGDGCVSIITTSVLFLGISEKFINGGDFISFRFLQEIFFSILEDEFGVEKLGIDVVRSNKSKADDKNFGRLSSRSSRLSGFNLLEEFIQNPDQRVIICGSEDLGDESTTSSQDSGSEFQGSQDQFDLREGILGPIGTDVGGTIIQDDINLFALDFFLDLKKRVNYTLWAR